MSDTTAQLEDRLIAALGEIRTYWPALLSSGGSSSIAGKPQPRSFITYADDDERDDDLPPIDRRVALSEDVTVCLNGWARVVVEDLSIHPWVKCRHGATVTLRWPSVGPTRARCAARIEWALDDEGRRVPGNHAVEGSDTLGLVTLLERHAQWFSGHEAASCALGEIAAYAHRLRASVAPTRREWMLLGACPLVLDEGLCGGQVRAYPDRDPVCMSCGTEAVASWWERVMFPDAEVAEMVTADELVLVLHRAFGGTPVKPSTIRQWIKRGVIVASGRDDKGRTLYDRGAVVYAVARRAEVVG